MFHQKHNNKTPQYNFLSLQLFTMAEPEVLSEFSDQRLSAPSLQQQLTKLPKIQHPKSRGQVRSKEENRQILPSLPPLKSTNSNPADPPEPALVIPPVDSDRNEFALEIEEKLKLVMENVNQGQIIEDFEGQSQVDFQERVQQNRQKIKQQKHKNESRPIAENKQQRKQSKAKSKTIKSNQKNDNPLYERRVKQYRDTSSENKYLLKKKEILAQRQQVIEKAVEKARVARQLKEGYSTQQNKQIDKDTGQLSKEPNYLQNFNVHQFKPSNNLPPRSAFKQKLSSKNLNKQIEPAPKLLPQQSKSANLFDNIHNLLENPLKIRSNSEMKKGAINNISKLQQKIKSINQKLGFEESAQTEPHNKQFQQKTVLDWKRIEYNRGGNLKCYNDSNFQKQVDKIGTLQQKNNDYLAQLVGHQKTLVELALMKKIKTNTIRTTS